jgi:hypothetical protein
MFKSKAIKLWRQSSEPERRYLVEDFFTSTAAFSEVSTFLSMGQPRPKDDKHAGLGIPSDPIWAVWAEKRGGDPTRPPRPAVPPEPAAGPGPQELTQRKARVGETLKCPYCDRALSRWEVPPSPFCEWPNEYMYVCFNNDCPYLVSGWQAMNEQGSPGFSYRLMYDPDRDRCMPVPVPSLKALSEYVIAPRG